MSQYLLLNAMFKWLLKDPIFMSTLIKDHIINKILHKKLTHVQMIPEKICHETLGSTDTSDPDSDTDTRHRIYEKKK